MGILDSSPNKNESVSAFLAVPQSMSDVEFKTISSYIEKKVGIKMPEEKKLMIQSRLTSRLKALRMSSFKEYIDYVLEYTFNNIRDNIKGNYTKRVC